MYSRKHRAIDCLQDIIDNIARIERHVGDLDRDAIDADELRHDAVERCMERLCEAAFRLGNRADVLLPGHPWGRIRGMGNRLRHGYDQIDFNVVWDVVSNEFPRLKIDAYEALERLQPESPDQEP